MKKYLIPHEGNFYKANLHMHTTISDGKATPEEVKAAYKAQGYSIVAYTDHNVLLSHRELCDDDFLAITSFEKDISLPTPTGKWEYVKTAHLNFYAMEQDNLACPTLNPDAVWGNARDHITEQMRDVHYTAEYSTEGLNEAIGLGNEEGFLVSLNHPVWSLQNYSDYIGLKGIWGVEVYNTGCFVAGWPDVVNPIDDLLRVGENVFPLATDDAHRSADDAGDYFGGYVMVKAPSLNYGEVMTALKRGDFYASTGQEIKEIYVENGKLVVECAPALAVEFTTERRHCKRIKGKGELHLTRADFDLGGYLDGVSDLANAYVRVTVTGYDGSKAYSRAFTADELKG